MSNDSRSLPGVELVTPPPARNPPRPARAWRIRSDIDLQARLPGLLRTSDWFGIAAIGFLIDTPFAWHEARPLTHSLGIVLGATATLNYLHLANAYSIRSAARLMVELAKVSIAWVAAFISLVTISYAMDRSQEFLSIWASLWFAASWLFLLATRGVARLQISRWQREGRLVRNIAVFGTGPAAFALAQRLKTGTDEANVVGVFIEGGTPAGADNVAGDGDLLASMASAGDVDEVILALPWSSQFALNRAIARFAASQVEVRIDPGISGIDYLARHRMKPGITGWAQVNGWRGETETTEQMRRRLEYDLVYIANWSLLLDIKVLLMTVPVVVRGTNAF
jgi:hypothetical protein